jgi:hypothetical protein
MPSSSSKVPSSWFAREESNGPRTDRITRRGKNCAAPRSTAIDMTEQFKAVLEMIDNRPSCAGTVGRL